MSEQIRRQYETNINNYRGSFETKAGFHYIHKKMGVFQNYLPPASPEIRLLEVGSADGVFTRYFSDLGYRVVGLDFAHTQIKKAASYNKKADFVQADGQILPFQDNSFDAIISMCTIRYFENADAAFDDFVRCLKPGGTLVVDVPNRFSPFFWGIGTLVDRIFGVPKPAYTRTYTREQIDRVFQVRNLTNVQTKHILLTYRYFPDWIFYIVKPIESIFESVWGLRRLVALVICAGQKQNQER